MEIFLAEVNKTLANHFDIRSWQLWEFLTGSQPWYFDIIIILFWIFINKRKGEIYLDFFPKFLKTLFSNLNSKWWCNFGFFLLFWSKTYFSSSSSNLDFQILTFWELSCIFLKWKKSFQNMGKKGTLKMRISYGTNWNSWQCS